MPNVVVTDTGPLHYLLLVGAIEVLPRLFGVVLVPEAVLEELNRPRTPAAVRAWAAARPAWLETRPTPPLMELPFPRLGHGERAAIGLARAAGAALLLTDDRAAAAAARADGFEATGTLGVLVRAAAGNMVELDRAFMLLRATNFHHPPALLDALVREDELRRGGRQSLFDKGCRDLADGE